MADGSTDPETGEIDVKRAVSIAKAYVREAFEDELGGAVPTLEEVWFDDEDNVWVVTVGVRHRDVLASLPLSALSFMREIKRVVDYKTVRVSARDGKPLSIRLRDSAA